MVDYTLHAENVDESRVEIYGPAARLDDEKQGRITRANNKLAIKRNKAFVRGYLEQHPCVDCGETDVRVLEFDHVRGKKKECISNLMKRAYSLEIVKLEISKCEIRCANDHKRRHFEEALSRPVHVKLRVGDYSKIYETCIGS